MHRIALDEHKHYTFALAKDKNGWRPQEQRIEHFPGAIEDFLPQWGGAEVGCRRLDRTPHSRLRHSAPRDYVRAPGRRPA